MTVGLTLTKVSPFPGWTALDLSALFSQLSGFCSMVSFQYISVFLVLGTPRIDTVVSNKCWIRAIITCQYSPGCGWPPSLQGHTPASHSICCLVGPHLFCNIVSYTVITSLHCCVWLICPRYKTLHLPLLILWGFYQPISPVCWCTSEQQLCPPEY